MVADGWASLIETLYNAVLCTGLDPVSGSPARNTKKDEKP